MTGYPVRQLAGYPVRQLAGYPVRQLAGYPNPALKNYRICSYPVLVQSAGYPVSGYPAKSLSGTSLFKANFMTILAYMKKFFGLQSLILWYQG